MMNREQLNENAKTLMEAYEISGTNAEVFKTNISKEYAKFCDFIKVERTDDEVKEARKPVDAAISLYNDEMRMQRLEQLEDMKPKDAQISYLENQCVKGLKFRLDKKSGQWNVDPDDAVELDAYDFISTMCSADLNGILDAACIFADNIAKMVIGTDGAAISKKSMSKGYLELRERKGWTIDDVKKLTYTKLAEQMNEVCSVISFGVAPKMRSSDVKFVQYSVIGTKSEANKNGRFVLREEKTILRAMFRAMYTRYHNGVYEFQMQARGAGNAPLTTAPNKAMAENPMLPEFKPEKDPKAGTVTLGEAAK